MFAHAEWHGARTMEHGALGMVQGACCKGHGAWKHGACAGWHNAIPLKSETPAPSTSLPLKSEASGVSVFRDMSQIS